MKLKAIYIYISHNEVLGRRGNSYKMWIQLANMEFKFHFLSPLLEGPCIPRIYTVYLFPRTRKERNTTQQINLVLLLPSLFALSFNLISKSRNKIKGREETLACFLCSHNYLATHNFYISGCQFGYYLNLSSSQF